MYIVDCFATWGKYSALDLNVLTEKSFAMQSAITFENIVLHCTHIAVPVFFFFFFSGYLFFKNYQSIKYLAKLKSRFFSLVIPYLFWNLLCGLFFMLLTNLPVTAMHMNMERIDFNLSFFYKIFMSNYNGPLWYVRNLIVITIFTFIIYYLLINRYVGIVIILASIVINILFSFSEYGIIYWLPTYLIGSYIGIHQELLVTLCSDSQKNIKRMNFLWTAFFAMLIGCGTFAYVSYSASSLFLFRVVSSFTVSYMLYKVLDRHDITTRWYMEITMFIYCIHFPIINILTKLCGMFIPICAVSVGLCFLLVPMLTLFISYGIAYLMKKFLPGLFAVLMGGR